jgi:hypothetical protein
MSAELSWCETVGQLEGSFADDWSIERANPDKDNKMDKVFVINDMDINCPKYQMKSFGKGN